MNAEYQNTSETPVVLLRYGVPGLIGFYRIQANVEARGVTRFRLEDSEGNVLAESNQKQLDPQFLSMLLQTDIELDGTLDYVALTWWTDEDCLAEARRAQLTVTKR